MINVLALSRAKLGGVSAASQPILQHIWKPNSLNLRFKPGQSCPFARSLFNHCKSS